MTEDNLTNQSTQASAQAQVAVPAGDSLKLSSHVVSKGDLSRALRELESINDFFHQSAIRGSKDQAMPTLGKVLDSLAAVNGLNLLRAEDRQSLQAFLTRLKSRAPIVHMSFPSEASGPFLAKILEWFRSEIHPHTLISVGLRPGLVAGCLVRTTNKTFDFSFKKKFETSKDKLIAAIQSSGPAVEVAPEAGEMSGSEAGVPSQEATPPEVTTPEGGGL